LQTRGERDFRACWPLILGVLFLDPRSWILVFGCFLGVLILVYRRFLKRFIFGFLFLALLVLGVASSDSGDFRLTRLLLWLASYSWRVVAGCFKGVSWEGLSGRVYAVSEDILLSEVTAGVRAKVIGRAFYAREASASRVAKWPKESAGFNQNIKKSGPVIMGEEGLRLVLNIVFILAR
jgi:hypothetical protein